MTTTHAQITQKLHAICQSHHITPLHAIESGSRAWGFASLDSDFDVRFIYHHAPDWYLSIYEGKDTFEFISHDVFDVPFDIGGWDIKKALVHIHKSNAVIFEWLNSPMVYHSDDDFVNDLKNSWQDFFNCQAVYHHYQGMAKKASLDLALNAPIKLKKWCYLIRALLASLWIKEHDSMPPVCICEMLVLLNDCDKDEFRHIIELKQRHDEHYIYQLPTSMQRLTDHLWQHTAHLTFHQKTRGDVGVLHDIFRKTVFH